MKNFLLKTITLFIFISSFTAHATRRYVDASAAGTNDGTSWTNAYTNLQTAIAASAAGDSLWIADGIYKPHASDRSISFTINGLALIGGFAGGENTTDGRNVLGNQTILSGDLSGNDVGFTNNSENSYRVVEVQGTGNAASINGIIVRGANSANAGAGTNLGAGIKIMDGTGTSLTITNCIIDYNAGGNGGGLYSYSTAGTHTVTVENCVFKNNSVSISGSAIYRAFNINLIVKNCTFVSNAVPALYSYTTSGSFSVSNSIFQNHTGTYILSQNSAPFSFDHCLFSDDPSASTGITTFTNNLINTDALLDVDEQLLVGSPAIDAGTNGVVTTSFDLAGGPRILYTTVDMGAFEYVIPFGIHDGNMNSAIMIFPNPVQDIINLNVIQGTQLIKSVTIYDSHAKEQMKESYKGKEHVSIHVESLAEGIYLLKIVTTESTQFVKLVK